MLSSFTVAARLPDTVYIVDGYNDQSRSVQISAWDDASNDTISYQIPEDVFYSLYPALAVLSRDEVTTLMAVFLAWADDLKARAQIVVFLSDLLGDEVPAELAAEAFSLVLETAALARFGDMVKRVDNTLTESEDADAAAESYASRYGF